MPTEIPNPSYIDPDDDMGRVVVLSANSIFKPEWIRAVVMLNGFQLTLDTIDAEGMVWVSGSGTIVGSLNLTLGSSQVVNLASADGTWFQVQEVIPIGNIPGLQAALDNRVRVDAVQAFNPAQKMQARRNIGAAQIEASRIPDVVRISDGARYNAFPDAVRRANGRIVAIWSNRAGHFTDGRIDMAYSDDNGMTWSEPTTIFESAGNDAYGGSAGIVHIDGVEYIAFVFALEIPDGSLNYRTRMLLSADDETWEVREIDTGVRVANGGPLEVSDGVWLFAAWFGTPNIVRVYRTTDYGETWDYEEMTSGHNESSFIKVGDDVFLMMRKESNTGYTVAKSSDGGVTWEDQATSFGFPITFCMHPRPIYDGANFYCPYRGQHGTPPVGGLSIMTSSDMLEWRKYADVPDEISKVSMYAGLVSIDGKIGLVHSEEISPTSCEISWLTLSKIREWSEARRAGAISDDEIDLPSINPKATRRFVETFATPDATVVDSGKIGQLGWLHQGVGSGISYAAAPWRPFGRRLVMTTGATNGNSRIIQTPGTVASATERSAAISFLFALPNWDNVLIRFGWCGGTLPGAGGTKFRMVELDRSVDANWRYKSQVDAGGSGNISEVLGAALTNATTRLAMVTLMGNYYNERKLGGLTNHSRIIVNQVNASGVGTQIADMEILDPGGIFNTRPFVEVHTQTSAAKVLNLDEVDFDFTTLNALVDGVPF